MICNKCDREMTIVGGFVLLNKYKYNTYGCKCGNKITKNRKIKKVT